jgi:hypothetical protein
MPEVSQLAQKKTAGPPQLSFMLNIARLLQEDSQFHNPWVLVMTPDLESTDLSRRSPIIAAAKHFRGVVSDSHRLAPIRTILEQHSNVRNTPIGLKDWGCREPNITLSSWTNLPMYGLEFASTDETNVSPEYLQISIGACSMFGILGASVDDYILMWVGKGGFWIQGSLDEKLWERIVDFSSFHQ